MSRFKRLTDAEAQTLTRREFTRIMHAYLSPASVAEAIQDTIDYIEGRSPGSYWDTRPGEETPKLPPMDAGTCPAFCSGWSVGSLRRQQAVAR